MPVSKRGIRGDTVGFACEIEARPTNTADFPTGSERCVLAFPYGALSKLLNLVRTRPFRRNMRDFASRQVQTKLELSPKEIGLV